MGKERYQKCRKRTKRKEKEEKEENEKEKEMERKVQELEGAYVCMRERESRTF